MREQPVHLAAMSRRPNITEGRVAEDTATVSMVALRFHSLRGDALSKEASRDLIDRRCDPGTMDGHSNLTWRKSSYSGGNGGQCVEVAASSCATARTLIADAWSSSACLTGTLPSAMRDAVRT
jgi:hypothetical protein